MKEGKWYITPWYKADEIKPTATLVDVLYYDRRLGLEPIRLGVNQAADIEYCVECGRRYITPWVEADEIKPFGHKVIKCEPFEDWLSRNPDVLASVNKGLKEAAEGKVTKVDLNKLKEDRMKTYKVELICDNCSQKLEAEILYGQKVTQYAMDETCGHCGCQGTLYLKGSW